MCLEFVNNLSGLSLRGFFNSGLSSIIRRDTIVSDRDRRSLERVDMRRDLQCTGLGQWTSVIVELATINVLVVKYSSHSVNRVF